MTVQLWVVAIEAPDACQIGVTLTKGSAKRCAVQPLTLADFEGMDPVQLASDLADQLAGRTTPAPAPAEPPQAPPAAAAAPEREPYPWEQQDDPGPQPDMDGPLPIGDAGQWGYDAGHGYS